jgi:RNA polymerase sigma-70 factor (ECF subfamily)
MLTEAAFTAAVEQYRAKLVEFAKRRLGESAGHRLGNYTDAEDVVQEALLDVWAAREHFRGEVDLRRWLLYAVIRELIDARRLRAIEARYTAAYFNEHVEGVVDPEDRDIVHDVAAALEGLPPLERKALWRIFAEGAAPYEVAHEVGLLPNTLRKQLSRQLPRVRERLAAYTPREEEACSSHPSTSRSRSTGGKRASRGSGKEARGNE